jgi:hypothetical protein
MPLSVEVRINGKIIETIWIARLSRFQGENEWHEYQVGVGTTTTPPWSSPAAKKREERGQPEPTYPRFHHLYSDGARVCVDRALNALRRARL